MTVTDYWVIGAFTLLVLVIGVSFSKTSGKDIKSFFAAGGEVPWWINSLSLFMGFHSAATFVVWGSIAYTSGWVAITIQWTMVIAGVLLAVITAPKWNKTKSLTAAEYITNRLGSNVQKSYSYIYLAVMVFSTGVALYAIGVIMQGVTGFTLYHSIILLGIIIVLYTTLGGLWSVVVTDVLQFVILMAVTIIVFILSLKKIGGFENFLHTPHPTGFLNLSNQEYTWPFLIAFGFYNFLFLSGQFGFVQRYTSVKTPKDASKVGFMFGALYVIVPIIWMLPPMIFRFTNPGLIGAENENAYLEMSKSVLPQGMLGLMVIALIMASTSNLQGVLNISSGVITNDLYKLFFPKSSEKRLLFIAKLANIFFGFVMTGLALLIPQMGGVTKVVISIGALTGGPMFIPILWSLFSKRQNGKSAITVTFLSLISLFFLKFILPMITNFKLETGPEMVWGVIIPTLLITISEIWLRVKHYDNKEYNDYMVYQKNMVVESSDYSVEADLENKLGIRKIGIGIGLTGLIILTIGILALKDQIYGVISGSFLIIIGLAIFYYSYKKNKK